MTASGQFTVKEKLSFVSYNCHGFNNGLSYLPVLLDSFDVVLLQEHWLSDSELVKLSFDDFVTNAVSGFDNSVLVHGRPYGGCAILYRRNLVSAIKQVKTPSRRFCAIKIDCHNTTILLINAYLPTDYRSASATELLRETLGDLCGFISTHSHDILIIAGDWNTDMRRSCCFTDNVSAFLSELNLSLVDLHFADNIGFTYLSHDGSKSWIDHVAVSTSFSSAITPVYTITDGRNLSDHNPLGFSVNLCTTAVPCPPVIPKRASVVWSKASPDDISRYRDFVSSSLAVLGDRLSDDVVFCCNPSCTVHQHILDEICLQLVNCLERAAHFSIPSTDISQRRRVAGWSQFVKPELKHSQWWHRLWVEAGSPTAGVLFQLKKLAHRRYKYAVRRVRRRQEHLKRTRLAEALLNDPNRKFWSEVRRFSGNNKLATAPVIDGVSGPENIANLWSNNFKRIYNTAEGSDSTDLLSSLDSDLSSVELDQISVSAETICDAIGKLKRGKIDGCTLVSDHVIEAPHSICPFLARLFTSVLRHGFMPVSLRDAIIQPIPKGSKDPSISANYRGIALASSLSKVLEWSVLLTWEQYFVTSDLQFGFKPGFSTTLCTGVMKAVVNRYLNRGSRVFACLIDASKAFDLVDHRILFNKLLQRNMPKPLVRLLLHWYKSQQLCVRWMGRTSECFQVSNGVRQGGVLSPLLFTIYIDTLLESLQASGRGCHWDSLYAGAFCYADDLTILAPSPDALRKMIVDCEAFAESHGLRFNASKTQLICFRRTSRPVLSRFCFGGQLLTLSDTVLHLGNTLRFDLSDQADIRLKTMTFIRKANSVLFPFRCTGPLTKMRLFKAYCLSLYGCPLWRLDSSELHSLSVSFNNVIRRIWNLPRLSRASFVHCVGSVVSVFNIVYSRFMRMCVDAMSHPSSLIRTIFKVSTQSCNANFIGYNYLYGSSHIKSYSSSEVAIGNLVREVRSDQCLIPGFCNDDLEFMVRSAVAVPINLCS